MLQLRDKGEVKAELRRALESKAERRGTIEADVRTGMEMAEKSLEGDTRRSKEAEARIGVTTEAVERAAKEAKLREVEEAPGRMEEGKR